MSTLDKMQLRLLFCERKLLATPLATVTAAITGVAACRWPPGHSLPLPEMYNRSKCIVCLDSSRTGFPSAVKGR